MVNHGDVFKLTIFLSSQWWQRQQVVCVERCGEHSDANVRKPAIVKNVVTIHDNRYTEHLAAVKAIAWSPHHHGLLASGGGTADRYIRFSSHELQLLFDRHHFTQVLEHFDGSTHAISRHWQPGKLVLLSLATPHPHQVCNLAWSKHASELVSTHGYSQNQILVWKYPSLVQVIKAAICLIYE